MDPFRVLEHTADIGFEAFGATRAEVFANAAHALMNFLVDREAVRSDHEVPIHVKGSDAPSLLVNWLSEILYLQDTEGWLFRDFEVQALQETSLVAVARGEKRDPARHSLKLLVKAITYHQLALEKTAHGWRAQVYVDI